MDKELKKKRQYIFDNIQKIQDHGQYIQIIEGNKCPKTVNSNGMFINLIYLNEEVIIKMYTKLYNELTNDCMSIRDKEKIIIEEVKEKHKEEQVVDVKEYDDIYITEFPPYEQDILRYSKKYHL